MCGVSKKSKKKQKDPYAAETARRAAALTEGNAAIDAQFAAYDDEFFDKRKQAFTDYAAPQVKSQYDDAYKQLVYALSRTGGGRTSAGPEAFANLQKQKDVRSREVVDSARAAANQSRSDVAAQRSDLIAMLNQTYDPAATMQSAQSRTAILNSAPTFSPIGDLFTLPAGLAADQITQARYNKAANGSASIFQQPTAGSSVRVV